MLSDYQFSAAVQIWPVFVVAPLSSFVYWFSSRGVSTKNRWLLSSHGWLLLAAFGYAIFIAPYSGIENWRTWIWPFYALMATSAAAWIYTLNQYQGSKWVHWVNALTVPSGLVIWFVGTMTITHDWL